MAGPLQDQQQALVRAWQQAETPQQKAIVEAQWARLAAQRPDESVFHHARSGRSPDIRESVAAQYDPFSLLGRGIQMLNDTPASRTARQQAEARALAGTLVAPPRAATAPAAPQGIQLAPPPSARAPAAQQGDPRILVNQALQQTVRSIFPNAQFSGGAGQVRNPEDYERLRAQGAPAVRGSRHETGEATDFKIPGKGAGDIDEVRSMLRAQGVPFEDVIYHNNHFHLELPAGGGQALAGGQGFGARPNLSAPSPNDLMSFIPNPQAVPLINLPDAPQRAAPAARPTLELADKEALLAPLEAAMAITPRDQSQDAWDRIQGLLQGAAAGASQSDGSVANMLLMGGAAGLGGFREERGEQRQLNREEEEANRQVKIALARMGFDVDTANLDTRNQNQNINWQSGEDVKTNDFSNATNTFETLVREMLTNSNIQAGNVGAFNQANMARGQVGANAVQDIFNVNNQAESAGWQLEQQRQIAAQGGRGAVPPGASLLLGVGLSPERQPGESAEISNARSAAGLIEMGNVPAGLNALATEMILSGRYANEELLPQETIKAIEQAIQQEKPQAAINLVLGALQSAPDQQGAVVDMLAGQGSLVATMLKARSQPATGAR